MKSMFQLALPRHAKVSPLVKRKMLTKNSIQYSLGVHCSYHRINELESYTGDVAGGPLPGPDHLYQLVPPWPTCHTGQSAQGFLHLHVEDCWFVARQNQPGRGLWGGTVIDTILQFHQVAYLAVLIALLFVKGVTISLIHRKIFSPWPMGSRWRVMLPMLEHCLWWKKWKMTLTGL